MPHFGLMNTDQLGPVEAPLMRAKLHMRAGKRRLQQGEISSGIMTLYDALVSAVDWFIAVPERKSRLMIRKGEDLKSERTLYAVLVRSGCLTERSIMRHLMPSWTGYLKMIGPNI